MVSTRRDSKPSKKKPLAEANPRAAKPPSKKSKTKKTKNAAAPPPGPPPSPFVNMLGSGGGRALRDLAGHLSYRDTAALTLVDKSAVALGDSPNTGDVWRRYLKTLEVDAWETYEKIPEDQRDVMERVYGCRKVCASLASGACRECGAGASALNVMTGERTCQRCWQCRDCGDKGNEGAAASQLCSVSYAKGRYLITDTDLKKPGIAVLKITDESKAHGLLQPNMTLMLVAQAALLAAERHGSLDGVEALKAVRHAKAMEKYRPKKEAYDVEYKAWVAEPYPKTLPYPKAPKAPKAAEATWNFVARNQRSSEMGKVREKYGLHICPPAAIGRALRPAPKVFVVTEDVDKARVAAKFSRLGAVEASCDNIFEAVHDAPAGATVVVDMKCDLRKQEQSCDPKKLLSSCRDAGCTIGDTPQNHTLGLFCSIRIIGQPGSCLFSDTACLWAGAFGGQILLEDLRCRTEPPKKDGSQNRSPCIILTGTGQCVIKRCAFEVGRNALGYAVLAHGKVHMLDSTVAQYGSDHFCGTMHFDKGKETHREGALAPVEPDVVFRGNAFVSGTGRYNPNPFITTAGFHTFFEHAADAAGGCPPVDAFRARLREHNTHALIKDTVLTFNFAATDPDDPTGPMKPVMERGGRRFVYATQSYATPHLAIEADGNTTTEMLLDRLAESVGIPRAWMYVVALPKDPRPHPLTTLRELLPGLSFTGGPKPAAKPSFSAATPPPAATLYVVDARFAEKPVIFVE